MTEPQPGAESSINLDEVLAEMDELGRAKFDAAVERVKSRKLAEVNQTLQARIAELEGQREGDKDAHRGVPNGRPLTVDRLSKALDG